MPSERAVSLKTPPGVSHVQGLSGLGWTQYRSKQFGEAAKTFSQIVAQHGDDKTAAPEAAFMEGKSYQDGKQPAEAAASYQAVLQKYPDSKFGYLAGLQRARLLADHGFDSRPCDRAG